MIKNFTNKAGAQAPATNPKNMIQDFINYLRNIKGYSENTCLSYEKDLRDFAQWAKANLSCAHWSTLTRDNIDSYIISLVAAGLKPATTNRRLSAIAGLYNFLRRIGHNIENPCKYESRRKIGKAIPNTIPYKEMEMAYEHAQGVVKVMLGLLATTGMRIQELLDMNWEDINFDKGAIKIHGKGNKERIVYTLPEQLAVLKRVADMNQPCGKIFVQDQRTARRMIWEALKPYSNAPQLSPHAIRHTFATHMAEKGVNCSTLATILGHNKLETTQQYIDLGQSAAQQACLTYALLH